jgi:hypothetical protein
MSKTSTLLLAENVADVGGKRMHMVWSEYLKVGGHFEYMCVDGRIILKLIITNRKAINLILLAQNK